MAGRTAYFARVGAAALAINLVVNVLFGLVLFSGEHIPWSGPGSLARDLLVGVALCAFITALATLPRVVRGAAAGLVAGLPTTSMWRFLPRIPIASSLLVAAAMAVLAMALMPLAAPLAPEGLSPLAAAFIKGCVSALGAHLAIVMTGLGALVGAPDRRHEHAAALHLAQSASGLPLESLDKGCLACTDRTRGISVAPVWHLVIDGDISEALLAASLEALVVRYPSLRTRVVPVDGVRDYARDFRYVEGAAVTPIVVPLEGPIGGAMKRVFDDFIDLFDEPPLRFWSLREAGRLHLLVHQHHAIADGRGFIGLFNDWAAIVRALEAGESPPAGTVTRRPERAALGLPEKELKRLTRRGFWRFMRESWRLKRRPLPPLPWNRGRDYSGVNRVVRMVLPVAQLEALRPVREAQHVSLNSLLTAAYMRAIRAWSRARGQVVDRLVCEVIVETRPRDGSFVSFANHLSAYLAEVEGPALASLFDCARAVQAAVAVEAAAQAHLERALFRGWGVHTVTIDVLRHLVLDVAELRAQVGFSNLFSLPIPELAGRGWRVLDVWVTTPAAPPHGIALTATSYGGRIAFNFNYKASVISEDEVRALGEAFVAELRTLDCPLDLDVVVH